MKPMMVAGALALAACGSGKPWDENGTMPGEESPHAGAGGASAFGGASLVGGESAVESGGRGGIGKETGGYSAGGAPFGYPEIGEGGASLIEGGSSNVGEGGETFGGSSPGGGSGPAGGSSPAGGGNPELNCLANVSHCFEAAANCFEYSPASDCDQIVDVCADMQADCDAATP